MEQPSAEAKVIMRTAGRSWPSSSPLTGVDKDRLI
jgi:hypothetical protein